MVLKSPKTMCKRLRKISCQKRGSKRRGRKRGGGESGEMQEKRLHETGRDGLRPSRPSSPRGAPCTCSTSATWELVRNAEPQVQTSCNQIWPSSRSTGDQKDHYSLKSTRQWGQRRGPRAEPGHSPIQGLQRGRLSGHWGKRGLLTVS